ncbi:MAG TPA: hypothetical protein VMT51_03280 [Dongiaceae bacterium]|nr:hypothetical protein [Dongiaceae bacterium]
MKNTTFRSILAIVVGIAAGVGITLLTDNLLEMAGYIPPRGVPPNDKILAVATAYRTVYGVLSAWLIARLAPNRPMRHVMIAGTLGLAVALLGAIVTWNHVNEFGPHWYPILLTVLALPQSWLGARLHEWSSAKPA